MKIKLLDSQDTILIEKSDNTVIDLTKLQTTLDTLIFNGIEYVDLGLPSGTLWAKFPIGATNEGEEGLFYAWAEVEGFTPSQASGGDKTFSWTDYKYGDSTTITKYKTTEAKLDASDDAAFVGNRGKWEIPSPDQFQELLDHTEVGFGSVTKEGGIEIKGLYFKNSDDKSKYIFLPCYGYIEGTTRKQTSTQGYYWTNTISNTTNRDAQTFVFNHTAEQTSIADQSRDLGINIIPVIKL